MYGVDDVSRDVSVHNEAADKAKTTEADNHTQNKQAKHQKHKRQEQAGKDAGWCSQAMGTLTTNTRAQR